MNKTTETTETTEATARTQSALLLNLDTNGFYTIEKIELVLPIKLKDDLYLQVANRGLMTAGFIFAIESELPLLNFCNQHRRMKQELATHFSTLFDLRNNFRIPT